jgi:hypothetical protein
MSRAREHVVIAPAPAGSDRRRCLCCAGRSHALGHVSQELANAFAWRAALQLGATRRPVLCPARACLAFCTPRRPSCRPWSSAMWRASLDCRQTSSCSCDCRAARSRARGVALTLSLTAAALASTDFASSAARMHLATSLRSWRMHLLVAHVLSFGVKPPSRRRATTPLVVRLDAYLWRRGQLLRTCIAYAFERENADSNLQTCCDSH